MPGLTGGFGVVLTQPSTATLTPSFSKRSVPAASFIVVSAVCSARSQSHSVRRYHAWCGESRVLEKQFLKMTRDSALSSRLVSSRLLRAGSLTKPVRASVCRSGKC